MGPFISGRCFLWSILLVIALVAKPCQSGEEAFIAESDCVWTKPKNCGTGSYKIDVHVAADDFPFEMKESALKAAEYWSKAIKGRPAHAMHLHKSQQEYLGRKLGVDSWDPKMNAIEGLLVFLKSENLEDNINIVATAQILQDDSEDNLPRVAVVTVNLRFAGRYDRCNWTNVMLHELGHALGFNDPTFRLKGLLLDGSTPGLKGREIKHEWDNLVGSSSSTYPPLHSQEDKSHWPEYLSCFHHGEVMVRVRPWLDRRVSVSRLTLAVFEDLGYSGVDYSCSDDNVSITEWCSQAGPKADPNVFQDWFPLVMFLVIVGSPVSLLFHENGEGCSGYVTFLGLLLAQHFPHGFLSIHGFLVGTAGYILVYLASGKGFVDLLLFGFEVGASTWLVLSLHFGGFLSGCCGYVAFLGLLMMHHWLE